MLHCLHSFATRALACSSKSPMMQVLLCPTHLGPCSIEGDPILPREVCSLGQILLGFLDSVISGGCVPLLPSTDSVVCSFIRVKALVRHEAASRSQSTSGLDMAVECVTWVCFLFEFLSLYLACSSDVRGGGNASKPVHCREWRGSQCSCDQPAGIVELCVHLLCVTGFFPDWCAVLCSGISQSKC